MAYETGSASDIINLFDKLEVFATNNGWTSNKRVKNGDGSSELYISKPDVGYFVFRVSDVGSETQDIRAYGATGFDDGAAFNNQPGSSGEARTNDTWGPFGQYHFFTDENSNYLHVAVENADSTWRHFGVGIIEKYASFTGGEYVYGLKWAGGNRASNPESNDHAWPFEDTGNSASGQVSRFRADIDGKNDFWFQFDRSQNTGDRVKGFSVRNNNGFFREAYGQSPNSFNLLSVLYQPLVCPFRDDGTYNILGSPRDWAYMNMEFYRTAEELSLGAETWVVFPVAFKSNLNIEDERESKNYAIALRKIL